MNDIETTPSALSQYPIHYEKSDDSAFKKKLGSWKRTERAKDATADKAAERFDDLRRAYRIGLSIVATPVISVLLRVGTVKQSRLPASPYGTHSMATVACFICSA